MVDRIFQRIGKKMIHNIHITEDRKAFLSLTNKQTGVVTSVDMDHIDEELIESMPEQLILTGYEEIGLILPD